MNGTTVRLNSTSRAMPCQQPGVKRAAPPAHEPGDDVAFTVCRGERTANQRDGDGEHDERVRR